MHIDHDALLSSLTDQCLTITSLSGLLSPHHLDSMLSSPIYLLFSGLSSPHTLGSVFSNLASIFLVGFRALTS
jgi:hypothetical protein